ncbi:hypothetical protein F0U60_34970 [Archangium minus]|uniref:Uncharacterized protein n=1 Tax=Archangium minus TaxID=83450 RepID=A0ABY9X032_9BACT|nr:hypothetical protein F0U60_34970 [Archangium minus]
MVARPSTESHAPPRRSAWAPARPAFLEGFSLHANTHLHANDRHGLKAALCCCHPRHLPGDLPGGPAQQALWE